MSTHARADCLTCGPLYNGPDPTAADRAAHLHATSKARGHVQHASNVRTHPKHLCTPECTDPRSAKP